MSKSSGTTAIHGAGLELLRNNMSEKKDVPILTPTTHLWAATGIGFLTFLLFILIWESVITHLLPQDWNKTFSMMISFFVIVPIPILIFDKFISARCPKCNGQMFGTSFRPPYKECQKCKYRYEYRILGRD